MQLREGREYVIQRDNVCPVDFRSTGIIELNKKWGDGLQQFVEIKHKVKLSTISVVTNYVSNISFFEMYDGKIYGTTGTLGTKADIQFLQGLYPSLSACKMPAFNRKKLFEVKGTLTTSAEEWKSEIKHVVMDQISPNSYRGGRAALVICETINKATEVCEELKSCIPGEIILYCRSDNDSLSKIEKELLPGDVIVATNLAGRGTDMKVSKTVNNNGGLFVVLSFLSENTRVELQAFGRTARKGKPGSAQIIMSTEHLQPSFRTASSLEEAKSTKDRLGAVKTSHMMKDIDELRLREELFSEYCKTLKEIHANSDGDEKRAVVAIMNEFWGIWLQTKSEEIDQLKRHDLQESLKADLLSAKSQCQGQTSPCSSIYHYIKFGNIALGEKQWDVSSRLFGKAIQQDEVWAAIAFYSRAYCTIMQRNEDYLTKASDDLKKAQESLKYLTEESIVTLQVVKMSPPANSDETSLEKQLSTKQKMLLCFDENITEAIKMLEDIKKEERNATAKKSPIYSLVSNAEEDLQVEADNLFRRGLQYVFSVEKEPRFPWEALLVLFLGVLQIIGGALLTAFTFGTLAQVGMGLITEGISDCIYAIESMVTGEFSWKSWAIEKAISIGISLIGFGIGKLIAKGFKASKTLLKGFGKQLKSMPKFLTRQAKDGLSVVSRTNMKNAAKLTAKKVAEELITYGLQKGEEEALKQILLCIENEVKKGILDDLKSKIEKGDLGSLVESIILSHVDDKEQLQDLLKDNDRKTKLLDIFTELSNTAIQPFYADLSLQNKLSSSFYRVIERAKAEVKGKAKGILTAIQAVHMGTLAAESIAAVLSLSSKFFSNLQEQLSSFKTRKDSSEEEKGESLSPSDTELLKGFKRELADVIGGLLAAALVEVFHQKFSSHLVSIAQSKAHGVISGYVSKGLKTEQTEALLRAGQNSNYIAHMPGDPTSKHPSTEEAIQLSKTHAEKITDSQTPGTLLDIRVLSETTGTKVVILTEDSRGKLTKMQELNPSNNPASQNVTLIYRPKSDQYPDGHYDVFINNETVSIDSKNKSCLFHAMARGMKPNASEAEITEKADRLRSMEADALLRHPGQWEPFIKRKEWTQAIRGGDWFMAEGAQPPKVKIKETKKLLKKKVGKVKIYKNWKKDAIQNPGLGQFINADHQPPVSSIMEARKLNQNSRLANAMLEVGTHSSPLDPNRIQNVQKHHGTELPTVYVPREVHREFPSTKSPRFRQLLTETIARDDVVGTFKLTILGSKVRSDLKRTGCFKSFQNTPQSKTRLSVFEDSFQQHSTKMVQTWSSLMEGKGVMTNNDLETITAWINKKGYNDQNDPHRNQVSNLL
ncbi:uncharacterized protein LOC117823798 [Notolabrus celidotus]|uniref:uncharacterized protein LOC117823798 n=1 Tax=Notolabrus celidotus TaxID=1203425 RepID=UPI00149046A6|nr:uncharacterized protein LOC117823798 [Notolabrus celidotus]